MILGTSLLFFEPNLIYSEPYFIMVTLTEQPKGCAQSSIRAIIIIHIDEQKKR